MLIKINNLQWKFLPKSSNYTLKSSENYICCLNTDIHNSESMAFSKGNYKGLPAFVVIWNWDQSAVAMKSLSYKTMSLYFSASLCSNMCSESFLIVQLTNPWLFIYGNLSSWVRAERKYRMELSRISYKLWQFKCNIDL